MVGLLGLLVVTLAACGSAGKTLSSHDSAAEKEQPVLAPEAQRRLDYYYLEAMRQKLKGNYSEAFALLNHCLEMQPRSGAVLYELFHFYRVLGWEAKCEEVLKQAVGSNRDNFWYKQMLATHYQQKRDIPKAIAVYEDMATQFPARLEPLLSLTELYTQTHSYERVIATLNRLEELDGKSEQISMEKFRMYLLSDQRGQAFHEIESLSREYPYDMRYKTILGDVYMENGEPDEAYRTYSQILQEVPGYAPALLSMANYYQKTGNDSLYRRQLDVVLLNEHVETTAKLDILRQFIAKSMAEQSDSTEIIRLFDRVLERPQPNADVAMLYSQYLLSKQMEKQSVPVLEKVLQIDPENKPARLQLLSFAIRDNRLEDVIKIAAPATEYHPETLEFYYYLGLAYYLKEDAANALAVFQKGVRQIQPSSDKAVASDFYAILGDVYHSVGQSAEAYAAYDSSLVYNPDNIATLNNYAYYLSVERTRLDKAEEMSYRTVKAEPDNATYLDTYAWILFEKGRYTEARIYIDQAMRNGGEASQVVVEHCGDIYYHVGDVEKAVGYWRQAEGIQPNKEAGEAPRPEAEVKRLKQKVKWKKYIK